MNVRHGTFWLAGVALAVFLGVLPWVGQARAVSQAVGPSPAPMLTALGVDQRNFEGLLRATLGQSSPCMETYGSTDFGADYVNVRSGGGVGCALYSYLFASAPAAADKPTSQRMPEFNDGLPVAIDHHLVACGPKYKGFVGTDLGVPFTVWCLAREPRYPKGRGATATLTPQGVLRWNLEALMWQAHSNRELCTESKDPRTDWNFEVSGRLPVTSLCYRGGWYGFLWDRPRRGSEFHLGSLYHPGLRVRAPHGQEAFLLRGRLVSCGQPGRDLSVSMAHTSQFLLSCVPFSIVKAPTPGVTFTQAGQGSKTVTWRGFHGDIADWDFHCAKATRPQADSFRIAFELLYTQSGQPEPLHEQLGRHGGSGGDIQGEAILNAAGSRSSHRAVSGSLRRDGGGSVEQTSTQFRLTVHVHPGDRCGWRIWGFDDYRKGSKRW